MPKTTIILLGLALLFTGGCATIVHGTNQQVSITSTPTGANVRVNGQYYGTTPLVLNLRRKEIHIVQLELAGYKDYEITLERAISAWSLGNAIAGEWWWFVGADGMDGAFYRLYPEEVVATLSPDESKPPAMPQARIDNRAVAQQLMDLKELLDAGVLSPEEYESRRALLMQHL